MSDAVTPKKPRKSPSKPRNSPSIPVKPYDPPGNWREIYDKLKEFRYGPDIPPAPVDTMGCDMLFTKDATEKEKRFQILCSLMLSSQTKDPVTAEAMQKLHQLANDKTGGTNHGITPAVILGSSDQEVNSCISKVGFHRKKTVYLRQVSQICTDKYAEDIPNNIEELLQFPGIGPKMGYLALQSAWGKNDGIGVDTHVHRIASRLKWVPRGTEEKGPEATRIALESWLPRDLWPEVNHLLVGMGQTICLPRTPRCEDCAICSICPSSSVKNRIKKAKTAARNSDDLF